jgi:hypothetical protein
LRGPVSNGPGGPTKRADDDDPARAALDCKFTPFFGDELEHYTALTDYTAKRAFMSADHDQRETMMRKHGFDHAVRIEKEHPMTTFRDLREAAEHYKRSGMSENLAKRMAASGHPELRYTTECDAIAKSEVGQIRKAAASGAARRHQIDDLVTSTCLAKKCDRQTAMRMVRDGALTHF